MTLPLHVPLPTYDRQSFDYSNLEQPVAIAVRQAAEHIRSRREAAIVEIGRELNIVKAALPHGRFLPWITAEFGWSHATALNFMRVADGIGSKYTNVAHLPDSILYRLAAAPAAVRDQVLDVSPDKVVGKNDVLHLLDEVRIQRKEDRKAARRAKNADPKAAARELRRAQRVAREAAESKATVAARKVAANQAAEIVQAALGDRLPVLLDLLQHNNVSWDFVDALLLMRARS